MIAPAKLLPRGLLAVLALLCMLTFPAARAQAPAQSSVVNPPGAGVTPQLRATEPDEDPDPINDAIVVAQNVPASMTSGKSYAISLTVRNTGNTTWTASSGYKLGSQNPPDNLTWGTGRVALGAAVAPGQQYTFSFNVTAPAAGSYSMRWKMLREAVEWFGATSSAAVTVAGAQAKPTLSVTRMPTPMVAGQPYTLSWSSTNASSVSHVCSASGTGYKVNETLAASGTSTGQALAAWVSYPSNCTWTVQGPGGSQVYAETMTTVASNGDVVTYIHTDGLGSPVARTGAAGNLISNTQYEPYGRTVTGAVPAIGFTGHVNDASTGLVYMQQRYYDPVTGRFLSIDPVTTDANTGSSFNRYAYVENNPYRYIDPDGRGLVDGLIKIVARVVVAVVKAESKQVGKEAGKAAGKEGAKDGAAAAGKEAAKGGGRAANKLKPVENADGPHSTIKRDAEGNTTNTATYTPNPKNPSGFDEVKRVDVTGKAHINSDGTKVSTPHVHEAGVKDVRPANPGELPSQ